MKKIVLWLALSFCYSESFALLCPTVNEIKNGTFNGWKPLYQYGEDLASQKDVEEFRKNVTGFHVARWNSEYKEAAHCFYEGTSPIVQSIVFARDASRPEVSRFWVGIRSNALSECYTSPDVCGFKE